MLDAIKNKLKKFMKMYEQEPTLWEMTLNGYEMGDDLIFAEMMELCKKKGRTRFKNKKSK